MRRIEKRAEPQELTQWRAANQADPGGGGINYGYALLRQSSAVVNRLVDSLLAEQGGLCAYTGRRIDRDSTHVEHLRPQTPWKAHRGLDVTYSNLVGCWPQPNGPRGQYGAHPKEDWPAPGQEAHFVSPLSNGCEARFIFNQRGEIKTTDAAAAETVRRLKLDHHLLTALRRAEIDSVLGATRNLPLKRARSRLRSIEEAEATVNTGGNAILDPYCFALKQALQKHIRSLEIIGQTKAQQ
ncbi:MAG: TIGR02646 family protein [Verrucomicrobia bacterium]|nr:TIGR02646 family protein [Verrucomicrobiota bacterium]